MNLLANIYILNWFMFLLLNLNKHNLNKRQNVRQEVKPLTSQTRNIDIVDVAIHFHFSDH